MLAAGSHWRLSIEPAFKFDSNAIVIIYFHYDIRQRVLHVEEIYRDKYFNVSYSKIPFVKKDVRQFCYGLSVFSGIILTHFRNCTFDAIMYVKISKDFVQWIQIQ